MKVPAGRPIVRKCCQLRAGLAAFAQFGVRCYSSHLGLNPTGISTLPGTSDPDFYRRKLSKTMDHHSGNRAAGWRIHICHFKEPGAQLFQLANNVPIFSIFFPPLFDKAIYREWAGPTQDEGREASEV